MPKSKLNYEEFKVASRAVVDKVKSLIHQGNIRRIILKDEEGRTFMEIPLTVATVGAIVAPVLAAVGALAAMVSQFTFVVEKVEEKKRKKSTAAVGKRRVQKARKR